MTNLFFGRFTLGAAALALLATSFAPAEAQRRREARPLPSTGEPGRVAAADLAFSKAAREDGLWTAFRATHTTGAVIHTPEGAVNAGQWLEGRIDPAEPVQWVPSEVWSSCDGTLAASIGRFTNPDNTVGSYVTVWKLQNDRRTYRWVYDIGATDNPQPPPPLPDVVADEETIVVSQILSINGHVADCPGRDQPRPTPVARLAIPGQEMGSSAARDNTLQYQWTHRRDGTRSVSISFWQDGAWQDVYRFTVPPSVE